MRNLADRINESLFIPGTGYDACDELTRDYNNRFAMLSGTTLRVIPTVTDESLYVLTGSCLRSKNYDFLSSNNLAVSTPTGNITPAMYFEDHGLSVFNSDGVSLYADDDPETFERAMTYKSLIEDEIKDNDYLIIF